MARIPYIAFSFACVLLLAGCSKNADQQTPDSLYWTPPPLPDLPYSGSDLLVLQLSADPVVYISHIPREQELTEDEQENGIIVMPSKIEDIFPRIIAYQAAQDAVGKIAAVTICGDDQASCGSVLKAIDCAKRAQVKYIFFETLWWPSGRAFKDVGGCMAIRYFEFPKELKPSRELAKNTATITLLKSGEIQWGDTSVTLQTLINEMIDLRNETSPENILLVIRVDADTPFSSLRYVLDQARRAMILKVSIVPRQ